MHGLDQISDREVMRKECNRNSITRIANFNSYFYTSKIGSTSIP